MIDQLQSVFASFQKNEVKYLVLAVSPLFYTAFPGQLSISIF